MVSSSMKTIVCAVVAHQAHAVHGTAGDRNKGGLKIRGVNLGGWLVLERWIKPSLFGEWPVLDPSSPKDQWTYCETLGAREARSRLEAHWDTWVTNASIVALAEAGVTHVRVPIGHWILGDVAHDEPYVNGEWPYLVRAAAWCRAAGIEIWLDLHTAPGSQNGFDNSGRLGNATWDLDLANVNRTLATVAAVSQRVKADGLADVVTGVGLLNEPGQYVDYWRMLTYYTQAYTAIRAELGEGVAVYIGDMFSPQSFNWFWHAGNPINATNVYLDSHIYACFVDDLKAMTPRQHVAQVCTFERQHITECCWDGAPPQPTELGRFVGEWTAAYDQTPSPELEIDFAGGRPLSEKRRAFLRQYVLAQMATYESSPSAAALASASPPQLDLHGWFFWNFRMEADAYREWDYLRGLREGWIPKLRRGQTVEDQLDVTCAQLVTQAADCTDDIVSPYPPLKNWVGVPCGRAEKTRWVFLHAIALFFGVLLALIVVGLYVAPEWGVRALRVHLCCRPRCLKAAGGSYTPINGSRTATPSRESKPAASTAMTTLV